VLRSKGIPSPSRAIGAFRATRRSSAVASLLSFPRPLAASMGRALSQSLVVMRRRRRR
jgi:hypothetical protein